MASLIDAADCEPKGLRSIANLDMGARRAAVDDAKLRPRILVRCAEKMYALFARAAKPRRQSYAYCNDLIGDEGRAHSLFC